MLSSSRFIDASMLSSMLVSTLSPSFLGTYCQSTSSVGCKALCIAMGALVLLSLCWSSSLVLFKNSPEYLTRGKSQVFIPLMKILLCSLISSSFFVILRGSFFFHLHVFHHIYPTPPLGQDMTQGQFLSGV